MPPKMQVSAEDMIEIMEVILKEVTALRADIKNMKMNMLQMQSLKVHSGARV